MKQCALLTGASGGIGLELARVMARHGLDLILVDIRPQELENARLQLQQLAPACQITCIVEDLAQPEAAERVLGRAEIQDRPIDVLVNNAGFGIFGFFAETDWERENRMIHLHVLTLTRLTKLLMPRMIERGRGKILNIASMAGFQPSPLMSIYYATKAYVLSFTQSIANELKGTGVTATVLCPGMVPTGFQQTVGAGRTKFSAKSSWMVTPVEYVAQFGYDAMMRGKSVAIPGAFNVLVAFLVRFVPRDAVTRFLRRAQEKNRAGQAPSKI
ncbi:MAG: SDR family NAD(P)-dependent oxidoreductase [Saprospiraceae bacterium]|jgi:hypothetical protein